MFREVIVDHLHKKISKAKHDYNTLEDRNEVIERFKRAMLSASQYCMFLYIRKYGKKNSKELIEYIQNSTKCCFNLIEDKQLILNVVNERDYEVSHL